MNFDSILEMITGSLVATFFGWIMWMRKRGQDRIDELEGRILALEQLSTSFIHLNDNQNEIKQDVKEIISVVTELRISNAAMNRRSND